jgi:carbon-monoxide dehydrogenase large subunit
MSGPAEASMRLCADDTVRFVGEPVAFIVAESEGIADDAAELVIVDIDPLDYVGDVDASMAGSTLLFPRLNSNVAGRWHHASDGLSEAFRSARYVATLDAELPRLAAAPIEPRGCMASYLPEEDRFELVVSAQDQHRQRAHMAEVFGVDPERIHVVVPDVGGAFGSKGALIPEYAAAALLAKRVGRAVRWIEDRTENLTTTYQGRGVRAHLELAIDEDGRFLGIRGRVLGDVGAYLYPTTTMVPVTVGSLLTGVYAIPEADIEVLSLLTNKVPTGPYRGAGRPEAAFFVEALVDEAARASGIDPREIRRRNFVSAAQFPYTTPLGLTYDSGNYVPVFDRACALLDASLEELSIPEGMGANTEIASAVTMYVERAAPQVWESGALEVDLHGRRIVAYSGSTPNGQGHRTSFAQIVADELGVGFDEIAVRQGDSDFGPGVGTFGSRSMTIGGEALVLASMELIALAKDELARQLEASSEDVVFEGGYFAMADLPDKRYGWFDIAERMDREGRGALSVKSRAELALPVFPFGAYGVAVAVDLDTGKVAPLMVVGVDDGGTVINPLLAEGQVLGSTLQGVSSALYEAFIYDDQGQPLTSNLADYSVPAATEASYVMKSEFAETKTPYTKLGAKGMGESGTIGALPAVSNAVNWLLREKGVSRIDPPFTPMRMWSTIWRNGASAP